MLRSEVSLPPSVNKTIDSRLDGGKHFESNCTCWQGQTAADCEKETISRRSSSTVCTHSNNVVTSDRVHAVGTPHGQLHRQKLSAAADLVTIYSQISPSLDSWQVFCQVMTKQPRFDSFCFSLRACFARHNYRFGNGRKEPVIISVQKTHFDLQCHMESYPNRTERWFIFFFFYC